jgi:hypothetical protein
MTGALTLNADPSTNLQAATKQYVDTIAAASLHYHDPVRVEKEGNLSATYNNGTAGVGATLTNNSTQAALVIDGVTLSLNDRVLIYEQTNAFENGIYTVTDTGSASTNWVLTRATDADSYSPSDPDSLGEGDAFFVLEGTLGAGELYVMNTSGAITFGTTAINFAQVSSAQVYTGGTGITISGSEISTTALLNVVEDTTPQLGGALSANGYDINMGTYTITDTKVGQWDTAYGWGDHSAAGYLTSYTETDPTVPSHVKSITTTEKANWNTAYGWGNHATAGYLTSIAANSVGANELNVSGNGSSSQFLRSDGDGTFTWATPTDTNTTYSAGRGLDLSGTQFLLETDLRDSISYIGYDSNDYIQWSNNAWCRMVVNGTERVRADTSGLDVSGRIVADSNITAYSDARLKDNVKTLDGSKVYAMRGVSFTKDGQAGSGVIAQELQEVAPELVEQNEEYLSVAYGNLVGYLIEAVKDLKAEIEELKNGSPD